MRAQDYAVFAWMAEGGLNSSSLAATVESNRRLQTEVNTITRRQPGGIWIMRAMRAVPLLHAVRIESRDLVARRPGQGLAAAISNLSHKRLLAATRLSTEVMYAAPKWPSRRRRRKRNHRRGMLDGVSVLRAAAPALSRLRGGSVNLKLFLSEAVAGEDVAVQGILALRNTRLYPGERGWLGCRFRQPNLRRGSTWCVRTLVSAYVTVATYQCASKCRSTFLARLARISSRYFAPTVACGWRICIFPEQSALLWSPCAANNNRSHQRCKAHGSRDTIPPCISKLPQKRSRRC